MIMVKVGCPMIIIHLMAKRFLLKQKKSSYFSHASSYHEIVASARRVLKQQV